MAVMLQTQFSHSFCFVKIGVFSPKAPIKNKLVSIGSGEDLAPNKWQAIIWNTGG